MWLAWHTADPEAGVAGGVGNGEGGAPATLERSLVVGVLVS